MRLGGPTFQAHADPQSWAQELRSKGYRAAYCPLKPEADAATVAAYREAAAKADIVIAEVGAWSNPLSPLPDRRQFGFDLCCKALNLADRVGARCAVNIAGSRGQYWAGPDPQDLTDETFGMIVDCVRRILDAVQPQRACFALETMPWMYPDSVESYERLLAAIDRPRAAVHFDPVNLVNCPSRYFRNGEMIREFVRRLGPKIVSCHFKDVVLQKELTVRLVECRAGTGGLDYPALLSALQGLDADLPVLMEHLTKAEEYDAAAQFIRSRAEALKIGL